MNKTKSLQARRGAARLARPGAVCLCLLTLAGALTIESARGQSSRRNRDAELGGLPSMPDLRQEDEKSFMERMKERRIEAQKAKNEQMRISPRPSAETGEKKESDKPQTAKRLTKEQKAQMPPADPNAPPPDFVTPSGMKLRSFSEPGYWQDEGTAPPEETIATLPSMPDLRPDSEKSWVERYREKQEKIRKVKDAQAAIIAEREERARLGAEVARQKALEAASRPKPPEPVYYAYNGPAIQPETPTGHGLKGYGRSARYVQNQQVVYQAELPESEGLKWIKRGVYPKFNDVGPDQSKWSWRNPFISDPTAGDDSYEVSPVPNRSGVLQGDAGSSDGVDQNAPLVSSLTGIRIVPRTREVTTQGAQGVQGVVSDGVILPPKVGKVLQKYLGQPMSLASLNKMVKEAIVAYRNSDMPVVDVLVPEQEITSGVLQLVIIEGRVGDVLVEGNDFTNSEYLENQLRLQRGQIIRESILMEDLAWMNKNPFRRVDLIYSPGVDYGTTDLILRTEEVPPLNFYVGYEDSGNDLLGQDRLLAGVNWGGPFFFGQEDILSYQYSTNLDGDADLQGHTGVWTSFLPWRHYLTLVGATVSSSATILVDGEQIDIGGLNRQAGGRYAIPLPSFSTFTQEVEFGFDAKSSNSDLFFNSLEVFDTTTEVAQFSLGYNITQRDRLGITRVDTEVVWSPGNLSTFNDDETFATQRAGASAEYVYGRARVDRSVNLPGQWSLLGRVETQVSNGNLLASETLGAGGYDSVRGFEQRLVRGDNGVVASLELRTKPVSLAQWTGFYNARDALIGLLFADYGYLWSADPLPDEERISLGSVGIGLRYQLDDHLTVRLDYGWQVDESGFDDGEDGRVHIGARASF